MTLTNRPIVFAATLLLSLASAAASAAWDRHADGRPGDVVGPLVPVGPGGPVAPPVGPGFPGRPGFPGDHRPGRPGLGEMIFVPVNQYLVGNNVLHVRQLLNLGPQAEGRAVELVVLRARTDFGRGQAQLLVNGVQAGYSQQVDTMTRDYFFQLDPYRNRLGYDIQTLQIQLEGRFTVEGVGVRLSRQGGFRNTETQVLRQQFSGQVQLDLARLFPGRDYQQLRSVTIVAATAAGYGRASVCSNSAGCTQAQTVATSVGSYIFPLYGNNVLGGTSIQLQGNFWIDSVTVEYEQGFRR